MAIKDELKKQVLFEDLSDELLVSLESGIEEMKLAKGDVLFQEGEDPKGVYLIRSGNIEVSKKTDDGWNQRLAVLTSGHFFGELSIMEKRVHEADAAALDDTRLFLLPKEYFEKIEKDNLELALGITKKIALVMCKNLRTMNRRFVKALINY